MTKISRCPEQTLKKQTVEISELLNDLFPNLAVTKRVNQNVADPNSGLHIRCNLAWHKLVALLNGTKNFILLD